MAKLTLGAKLVKPTKFRDIWVSNAVVYKGDGLCRRDRVVLLWGADSALDTGKYAYVSFDEVAKHIEEGTIFEFLATRLSSGIDLSTFDETNKKGLIEEWQDILAGVSARRKLGVQNNGICLLVTYLLEGIQRRQDSNRPIGQHS